MVAMSEQWHWCLTHERVELADACKAADRLGPYPSREAARDWRETHQARGEAWETEDERWDGPDDG